MKKILTLLFLSSLFILKSSLGNTISSTIENEDPNKFINIKVAPVTFFLGFANATVDIGVGKKITIGPSFDYYFQSMKTDKSDIDKLSGYSLGAELMYHFEDNQYVDGWNLTAFSKYIRLKTTEKFNNKEYSATVDGYNLGALLGYQWIWSSFNVQLKGGLQYFSINDPKIKTDAGREETLKVGGLTGVLPAASFTIGWSF